MLSKYDLLPEDLARWSDQQINENLRTAVPFVGLGLLIGSYLLIASANLRWWLGSWLGLIGVVLVAEAGQLLLPQRTFDWYDVSWGATGAFIGLLPGGILLLIYFIAVQLRRRKHTFFFLTAHEIIDLRHQLFA